MDQSVAPTAHRSALTGRQRALILATLITALFLTALNQTIVTPALSTIGRSLHDVEHLSWVITAFLVAGTAVTPLYGKLGDVYGRRVMLLTALVVYLAGSVACALSNSILMLVLARAVQGLGGGGVLAMSQTILGDVVSPRERGRYQAYFSASFAVSGTLGPVFGGVIAERLHWTLIFWLSVPIGLVALALSARVLKLIPRHEKRHRIDFAGGALMVVATVGFLLALSWGGRTYPWGSPQVLGLLGAAILSAIAFVFRLSRAPEPFIPLNILSSSPVRNAMIASFFTFGAQLGTAVYVPFFYQGVHGFSVAAAGLALVPLSFGTVIGSGVAGRLLANLRNYRLPSLITLPISISGLAVLAIWAADLPAAAAMALLFLVTLGLGTNIPLATVSVQNAVPLHQLGTATGALALVRQLGGAVLVTLFGVVLFRGLLDPASGAATPEALGNAVAAGSAHVAGAFRAVFLCSMVAVAASLFFVVRLEPAPLRDDNNRD